MRALGLVAALLMAAPALADPFGLIALPDAGVEGPVTQPDGTILFRDDAGEVALCDPSRGRNFADLVIELQMAQTVLYACPGLVNPTRTDQVAHLREIALPRYAERVESDLASVRIAFQTRADAEIPLVTRCGVTANRIVSDVADPWFETRLREAMEAERPPAVSCPQEF